MLFVNGIGNCMSERGIDVHGSVADPSMVEMETLNGLR